MMYDKMRQLQLLERNSNLLQEVNPDFYNNMQKMVLDETDLRLARSKKVVYDDIRRIRFRKIVDGAIRLCEKDEELINMTDSEKTLFESLKKEFSTWLNETHVQ